MAEKLQGSELSFNSPFDASKYFSQHRKKSQTDVILKDGDCSICFDETGRTLQCTHFLCADCIIYYTWEQVVRGEHIVSCPLCNVELPSEKIMELGEVAEIEKVWLERFLLVNLEESLNTPLDISYQINQVLQASPLKEIFDSENNKLEIPTLRACPSCSTMVEHTMGCYKIICVSCQSSFCFICLMIRTEEISCPTTMIAFKCEAACKQSL